MEKKSNRLTSYPSFEALKSAPSEPVDEEERLRRHREFELFIKEVLDAQRTKAHS